MKTALIIGSSGGIGSALTQALTTRGVSVTGLSRRDNGLDVTDEPSVKAALGALDGPFDFVLVATGALEINGAEPEKTLRHLSADAMIDQFRLNAVGPSLVLKHAVRLLPRQGRAVFAALSARVGSIGDNRLGGWYSYRTSKAALNQMLHGASVELARTHKDLICVALHPGTVETKFTEKYVANHPTVSAAEAAANLLSVLDGLTAEDTGKFFDWQGKEVPW
ncbi:SDR family NAD(P)-dependent oxidoreductase [Marivita sp. XM-24bin2]|jgi:NAD(P)-dependent dehydrogenase (short-subunit alcohol dehydrogenase family)|uniref:SDR family NAD(P)-dependent oxidoreductase n=1 Tax=unclassified Marivita TaxID=2632480 RepID=UPI000D7AAE4D|nr:SDR family NAD(P)-dependent oxidoreductase [Marivita sp. XM-24bin2]MCR9109903.1 SDR family NAD(P)-dependent oxidoreductase [Paracoccaceae bacterium]PWL36407.1 MAG: C factor, cell signaling protein [Marivita sp. XM-24bin2]